MVEINDDKSSHEKIVLTKSGDDRYFPQKGTNNNEVKFCIYIVFCQNNESFKQRHAF